MLKKKIKCTTGSIRSTVPKDLTGSIRPNGLTGSTGPTAKFGCIVGSTGINQCDLVLVERVSQFDIGFFTVIPTIED